MLGARRPAATCTRSRTTATRGAVPVGRRRRSIGSQRALGPSARRGSSTPCSSAWSTGSRAGCARPSASGRTVVLRLRFDDFTRATRSHTLPVRDVPHRDDAAPPRAGCSPRALPLIERRGLHAGRHLRRQPRRQPAAGAAAGEEEPLTARRGAGRGSRPLRRGCADARRPPRPPDRLRGPDAPRTRRRRACRSP